LRRTLFQYGRASPGNSLTAGITKQHAGYENRGSYGVGGTECHVYVRND